MELKYCKDCNQMTNHKGKSCLKCKMEYTNKVNKLLKPELEEMYKLIVKEFPGMIEKNEILYIEPVYRLFPEVIKKIQENWEVEFIYDKETATEVHSIKPLNRI